MVSLKLRKEDLFTLLLHHRYFHCSTEVATLEVAEKLHSTPRELVHWHECGLLGCTTPANQLVAYVWESGAGLKVILDTLIKVCLVQSALFGHCFAMMLVHLVGPTPWKHWPMRLSSNGPLYFCVSDSGSKSLTWNWEACTLESTSCQIEPDQAQHDR